MRYRLALCVAGAAALLMGCWGGGARPSELTGQWVRVDAKSDGESMELLSDGKAVYKKGNLSRGGTWSVVDKRLLISASATGTEVSEAYNYKASGYELTIVDGKGSNETYVKKGKLEEFMAKQAKTAEAKKARLEAEMAELSKRSMESLSDFTDSRDDKTYRKVTMGTQTWMAENLNYKTDNSKCFGNTEANCQKYGRLYNWADANGACPAGWHLPTDREWTRLTDYVGGSSTAVTKLKSQTGWYHDYDYCTDEYGFSALPGGYGSSSGGFYNLGEGGGWWSATERSPSNAWLRLMYYDYGYVYRNNYVKTYLFSVRCVQD